MRIELRKGDGTALIQRWKNEMIQPTARRKIMRFMVFGICGRYI